MMPRQQPANHPPNVLPFTPAAKGAAAACAGNGECGDAGKMLAGAELTVPSCVLLPTASSCSKPPDCPASLPWRLCSRGSGYV